MKEFALGRIFSKDERDGVYMVKHIPKPVGVTSKYWSATGWFGNQGNRPHCVGFSWAHWLEDAPVSHSGNAPIINPAIIYKEAQKLDDIRGENYDGTTVRGAAKYLKSIGFITEYNWAFDLQTMINCILVQCPVVVGTNWYSEMFNPKDGLIKIGGRIVGGHAYVVNGVNTKTKLFRLKNSWGREWGKNAHAYISFADMERLIHEDGEICLGVETKV